MERECEGEEGTRSQCRGPFLSLTARSTTRRGWREMPRAMREGMEGTPQGHRRDMCEVPGEGAVMPRSASTRSTAVAALHVVPQLGHETLYLGIDVGKAQHVAGFVSRTLLAR